MTFAQFFSILKARKWAAFAVFASVVALVLLISLLLPKQYTGIASVVVDVKPDPVAAMAFPTVTTPAFIATQVDILTSDRVTLRVIRDLKLTENPDIRQQWLDDGGEGTLEQWLALLLQKKLDVSPSKESSVINISYKAPDPNFAAAMANAFARAYLTTIVELRVDPAKQFNTFFAEQSREARESLERAQNRLSAFQQQKGIIATDERLDVESARLAELSSQLVQIQALASESSSRQAQASGGSSDRIQEVLNNPLIGSLKADLTRSEAKLQELNSKLGQNHPQVIEIKANIEELRKRIDAETRRVTSGVGVSNTINRQREADVRRELEAQRNKMLQMKETRDEGQVLVRDVENAQRAFDNLIARLNQSSLESQTTQSYANMLTSALPPSEHSSPKILLNTILSILLGGLLAVGAAMLMEMRDRRIREPEDVLTMLGLPVIGALPKPNAKRFAAGNRALLSRRPIAIAGPSNPTQGI